MVDSCGSNAAASQPHSLFQVYLRLRPPAAASPSDERFITVESPADDATTTAPTHITLVPPNDRRRAIEKFAFTHVFEEDATQLDVFHRTNVVTLVEGVLAPHGGDGRDALLATLGVTGSGKVLWHAAIFLSRGSILHSLLTWWMDLVSYHTWFPVAARLDTAVP